MNESKPTTPAEVFPPGEFLREELEARGWTQSEFASILGRPVPTVNLILSGKKAITPDTAKEIAEALGTSADLWLNLQTAYDLAQAEGPMGAVSQRAKMYELAPVKEMVRRGWIRATDSADGLANELCRFFRVENLRTELPVFAAARQSATEHSLTAPQRAWCVRALQLGETVNAADYRRSQMPECIRRVRQLAAHAEEARHLPKLLGEFGIRFVVVEHLASTKIDGAALWLSQDRPVLAVSIRFDRINWLWHTICHELSHIHHGDNAVLDTDLVRDPDSDAPDSAAVLPEMEKRADAEAAAMLVPPDRLNSFIIRVRPYYSKQRIIQFAHTVGVHPGIVAGQLQHLGQIKFSANTDMLVKVRSIVTSTAVTDGWGKIMSPQ